MEYKYVMLACTKNGIVQQTGKMECFLLGCWRDMSLSASPATPCLAMLLSCLHGLCRGVCTTACAPLGLSDGWSECVRQPSYTTCTVLRRHSNCKQSAAITRVEVWRFNKISLSYCWGIYLPLCQSAK